MPYTAYIHMKPDSELGGGVPNEITQIDFLVMYLIG